MPENVFLQACKHLPVAHKPVWFMRQAGRYLPEYRAIKERSSFLEMCKTPELAVEITLQPVRAHAVDVAILFSDILIPIEQMGIHIEFRPGPVIPEPIRTRAQIDALRIPEPQESVPFVLEALHLLRGELDSSVALVGFCGAPWTLGNYVVEGGGAKEFTRLKRLFYEDPEAGESLLQKLAETNAAYLCAQIDAGAQAVQIFDTWAGILNANDYARWALPAVQHMVQRVHAHAAETPVIYFARDSIHSLQHVAASGADVLSLDWRVRLDEARKQVDAKIALQGNLDPAALFAPWTTLQKQVDLVLQQAGPAPGHIFNLGHGVLQHTPVENVTRVVEYVHAKTQKQDGSDVDP